MIADLHAALSHLLYDRGRIPSDEVDISFELPTKQWVEARTRPTINLYLFDVEENTSLRSANVQTVRHGNSATMRMPPRRVDLRYLVGALTSVVEDEHLLLWRILATLMKYNPLPRDVLPETLQTLDVPLATKVGHIEDAPRALDMWSALDVPPRPALVYVVTAPVDLEIAFEAPLVLSRTIRYARPTGEDERAGRGIRPERSQVFASGQPTIGGTLRNGRGEPLADALIRVEGSAAEGSITNIEGRFTLSKVAPGTLTLHVTRSDGRAEQVQIAVPSNSYDIILNE